MRQRIYKFESEHRQSEALAAVSLFHHTQETHSYLEVRQMDDEELLAFFHEMPLGSQVQVTFEVVESE